MYPTAGERKSTFLTEKGVYKLVIRSKKTVAKPFQNWVFELLKTIRKIGKYVLEGEIAGLKRQHAEELGDADADATPLARKYMDAEDQRIHKTLVQGCGDKTCIYLCNIKTMDDNSVLVKIGSTKNIRSRTTGSVKPFESMAITMVFECDRYEQHQFPRNTILRMKEIATSFANSDCSSEEAANSRAFSVHASDKTFMSSIYFTMTNPSLFALFLFDKPLK